MFQPGPIRRQFHVDDWRMMRISAGSSMRADGSHLFTVNDHWQVGFSQQLILFPTGNGLKQTSAMCILLARFQPTITRPVESACLSQVELEGALKPTIAKERWTPRPSNMRNEAEKGTLPAQEGRDLKGLFSLLYVCSRCAARSSASVPRKTTEHGFIHSSATARSAVVDPSGGDRRPPRSL